jgi:hypothetical protein
VGQALAKTQIETQVELVKGLYGSLLPKRGTHSERKTLIGALRTLTAENPGSMELGSATCDILEKQDDRIEALEQFKTWATWIGISFGALSVALTIYSIWLKR